MTVVDTVRKGGSGMARTAWSGLASLFRGVGEKDNQEGEVATFTLENKSEVEGSRGSVSSVGVTPVDAAEFMGNFSIHSHLKGAWNDARTRILPASKDTRPTVGVYADGRIRFSPVALEMLGNPKAVRLGFMKNIATGEVAPGVFSVHPSTSTDKMAYTLSVQKGTQCRYASATGFFKAYPSLAPNGDEDIECQLHPVEMHGQQVLDENGMAVFIVILAEGQARKHNRRKQSSIRPLTAE